MDNGQINLNGDKSQQILTDMAVMEIKPYFLLAGIKNNLCFFLNNFLTVNSPFITATIMSLDLASNDLSTIIISPL